MSENWGYSKLHDHFEKRAIDEMKHAEKLIGRVLFLEGIPLVSKLLDMHIGAEVPKQLENDHLAEEGAIKAYNAAIVVAGEVADFATREVLEDILKDEDSAHRQDRGASGPDQTHDSACVPEHSSGIDHFDDSFTCGEAGGAPNAQESL